jgi:hypothetical protein
MAELAKKCQKMLALFGMSLMALIFGTFFAARLPSSLTPSVKRTTVGVGPEPLVTFQLEDTDLNRNSNETSGRS